ncbi:MAG: hypothetical protein E7057_11195 [Lentisphaerae bacterium]|nr:hypothetical protein [Lentisphaerota bacterium]
MKKAVRFHILLLAAAVLLSVAGCNSLGPDNNYRMPRDFVRHMQSEGIKVSGIRPLDPKPLSAGAALEAKIGNSNIGIYKYDITNKNQRSRLEKIRKSKRIYFNGIPYPIYEISGSFIVVGLDKNKEKQRILQALRSFK